MKKLYFLFFWFSLAALPLLGRSPVVLMQQLNRATSPQKKVELLNLISEYYREVEPKQAVLYGQQAAELAQQLKNREQLSAAYNNISIGHYWLNNLIQASEFTYKAMKIREALHDSVGLASSYNALGSIHLEQHNYDLSLSFFQKALDLGRRMKRPRTISASLNNIGSTYELLDQPEKALGYYLQVKEIDAKAGDQYDKALSDLNLGNIYFKLGNKKEALSHLYNSLALSEEIRNEVNKMYIYRSLAQIHLSDKEYQKAAETAQKSLDISLKISSPEGVKEASKLLNEAYLAQKNYPAAHRYLTLHTAYKDSLQNRQRNEAEAEMHAKYELERKEDENHRLRVEQELQAENLTQKSYIQYATGILLLLSLALAYVFFKGRRRAKRANEQLYEFNLLILEKNQDIQQQKEELEKLNHQKDLLFSIIAHDLRSPLISLQSLLQLLSMGKLPQEKLDRFMKELDMQQQNTIGLLDNLLVWAKIQMKGFSLEPEPLALRELVEQNLQLLLPQADKKGILLLNNVPDELCALVDEETLKLVFRNLLSNSIKFCTEGDTVEVMAEHLNEYQLIVTVKDCGMGISDENQQKLFGPNNFKEKGTANEKGNGLGLMLCKEFIEKNGGEIWVESELGNGSLFHFTVPSILALESSDTLSPSPQEESWI
ncbi:tetratricopeptide repeat protein [Rufibacter sediminis]|uniref:histidine kinase n=1 Tax=Rufibacter sediminis TaxID=2762756 RepID=A0ABR6VWS0_9BACT|nr:tetratricopeptide repeat-containing sensor histidine kinase [Rufibacter sediminis]MBC3541654.1 tetratricopeptide repeat-containing sensor histidine kinase [Rufibacter sediminis]